MTAHIERERKYEVGDDGPAPPVSGLTFPDGASPVDPSSEELQAVYFDTPDLRLTRAGVTLRRRAGGPDEGWHLKVPTADADTRVELRLPLDDADGAGSGTGGTAVPPAEFAELLVGHIRGARLEPVAHIVTDRTRWQLLGAEGRVAELTDDRVEATDLRRKSTGRWREVEVELTENGDPALLESADAELRRHGLLRSSAPSKLARALRWEPPEAGGSADDTAGGQVLDYLRAQIATLTAYDLAARRAEPDAVHQLRVATRRLRSTLRAFRGLFDRRQTEPVRAELRWLGRRLGPARDLEVMEKTLNRQVAELPAELVVGPVSARLTRHFAPARADAAATVEETLRSDRYLRLLDALDRLVAEPPLTERAERPAATELPRHVRKAYRRTKRRVRRIDGDHHADAAMRDEALHDARKAAKRLRYAAELARPTVGKPANRLRKRAKKVASVLGEHQDSVVVRPLLRQLGAQAQQAGENGFTFGVLHDRHQALAEDAERRFGPAWERVTAKKARRWLN
ncbi:CYTH and CHAD domain-containing protein [Jiangella ureilytica]|uniref:CYTH and CHAD domain-containing protein n=1 Tax=Jiangella ureilytica TaxID=2530374 RepID=A0A4R4RRU7_9ACTN|nr:CYTH and CHAD domain-containing protein [Jiangella ureilytica]TDC51969.1 CYTH and CHAD domain-containing protein [Jiangella ureilytica]